MSIESTRAVIQKYVESDHAELSMMAEDVVFIVMATGQEYPTPAGVQGMLEYFYRVAFDAVAETKNLIFSDTQAVWEGDFVGTHIGEFAGIPSTGKSVRVPLCVFYDLEDDKIKQGRVYFEMPALFAQLGIDQE